MNLPFIKLVFGKSGAFHNIFKLYLADNKDTIEVVGAFNDLRRSTVVS